MRSQQKQIVRHGRGRGGDPHPVRSKHLEYSDEEESVDAAGDFSKHETLQENFEALLSKERRLMEITLARKDRQIIEMERKLAVTTASAQRANSARRPHHATPDSTTVEVLAQDLPEPRRATVLDDQDSLKKARTLPLRAQGINEESLRRLSRQIAFLPQVTSVDLSHNELGDGCAQPLAALLSSKSKVKSLDLSSNRLGVDAAHAVCRALRRNRELTSLDMSSNPFGSVPMVGKMLGEMLSENHTLTSLNITVAEPRRDRESGGSRGNTSKFVSSITQSPSIVHLGMVGASLPRATVAALAHSVLSGKLVTLDLRFAFIGPNGAASLSRALLPRRRNMRPNSGVGSGHCALSTLILASNAITNIGCRWIARAIARNTSLTLVDLSNNGLTDPAAESIAEALCSQSGCGGQLTTLSLGRNPFGDGPGGAALLDALEHVNGNVQSLGPSHDLYFSISLRQQILEALNVNKREAAHYARDHMSLLLSQDEHRELIVPRPTGEDNEHDKNIINKPRDWVKATEVVMPSAVAGESAGVLILEWESSLGVHDLAQRRAVNGTHASVGVPWRLTRSAHDAPTNILASGGKRSGRLVRRNATNSSTLVKGLAWHQYTCRLPVVEVSETLHLWLCASNTHLRALKLWGPDPNTRAAHAPILDAAVVHIDGRDVIKPSGVPASVGFVQTHSLYLHAVSAKVVVEWEGRAELTDGAVLRKRQSGVPVGLAWRITCNGKSSASVFGGAEDCRLPNLVGVTLPEDDGIEFAREEQPELGGAEDHVGFARYCTSLPTKSVGVADTLQLWVSVPGSELQLRPALSDVQVQVHVRRLRVRIEEGAAVAAAALNGHPSRNVDESKRTKTVLRPSGQISPKDSEVELPLFGSTPFTAIDTSWA